MQIRRSVYCRRLAQVRAVQADVAAYLFADLAADLDASATSIGKSKVRMYCTAAQLSVGP
jgi:predicted metal-binding protein